MDTLIKWIGLVAVVGALISMSSLEKDVSERLSDLEARVALLESTPGDE